MVRLSEDIHDMSRQLHPALLEDLGLVDAIASECARFSDHEEIRATFRCGRVPDSIPRDISLCLYRVLQEALRNIAKHSGATKAQIALKAENGSMLLSIRDDGTGFDPTRSRQAGGVGLASLGERVRLVRGSVGVRSRMGQGTMIEVRAPLPDRTPKTKPAT